MRRYTKDMPADQSAARHVLDAACRVVGRDRHRERVDERLRNGLPPTHAQKQARDRAEAIEHQLQGRFVELALQAHGDALALAEAGAGDPELLQALAQDAMRGLAERGFISGEHLHAFLEAPVPYLDVWRDAAPAGLPADPDTCQLCRAAFGQAFIDAGIAAPEGAERGAAITPDRVYAWRYF